MCDLEGGDATDGGSGVVETNDASALRLEPRKFEARFMMDNLCSADGLMSCLQ